MIYTAEDTALLIDLDGTLIDSHRIIAHDLITVFSMLGRSLGMEDALRATCWATLAEKHGLDPAEVRLLMQEVKEPWQDVLYREEVRLYEDTVPTLEALSKAGYSKAVLTRSNPEFTDVKLDYFELRDHFQKIGVVPPDFRIFPDKSTHALSILISMGACRNVFMIGDSEYDDMRTAHELKSKLGPDINVNGVYINRNDLAILEFRPDYERKTLSGLLPILEGRE